MHSSGKPKFVQVHSILSMLEDGYGGFGTGSEVIESMSFHSSLVSSFIANLFIGVSLADFPPVLKKPIGTDFYWSPACRECPHIWKGSCTGTLSSLLKAFCGHEQGDARRRGTTWEGSVGEGGLEDGSPRIDYNMNGQRQVPLVSVKGNACTMTHSVLPRVYLGRAEIFLSSSSDAELLQELSSFPFSHTA